MSRPTISVIMRLTSNSRLGPAPTSPPSRSTAMSSASAHDVAEDMRDVDHRLAGLRAAGSISANSRSVSRAVSDVVGSSKMMTGASSCERLGDLDELPFARRQPLDQRVRGELEIDLRQELRARACIAARSTRASGPPPARESVDEDVFGDREVGEEVELLVDEGDAGAARLAPGSRGV